MFMSPFHSIQDFRDALESESVVANDKTSLTRKIRDLNMDEGSCNLVLLDEQYFETGLGIALPKGMPFKENFDKA